MNEARFFLEKTDYHNKATNAWFNQTIEKTSIKEKTPISDRKIPCGGVKVGLMN